jgi:LPXTG-motif cell wall-anchored protein
MRNSVRTATALAIAGGIVGFPGAGPAAADPVSRTLRYTCSTGGFSLPFKVRIDANIPKSVAVDERTPKFALSATAPLNADTTKMLNEIGVKTVKGRVDAKVHVAVAPKGDADVNVRVKVKTTIPASGAFSITARGFAPPLTFRQPGRAKITIGDLVAQLTPKNAKGEALGQVNARCKLEPSQDNVIGSFRITEAKGTTGPSTPGTAGSGGAGSGVAGSQDAGSGGAGTTDTDASGTSAADEPASGATASQTKGALPHTGAATGRWLLGGAGVLLAAGTAAFFAARRIRTDGGADAAAT